MNIPDNAVPVKIGRRYFFAVYSEDESNLPNAKPTYRVYTADNTYFMHLAGWEFENARQKAIDSMPAPLKAALRMQGK